MIPVGMSSLQLQQPKVATSKLTTPRRNISVNANGAPAHRQVKGALISVFAAAVLSMSSTGPFTPDAEALPCPDQVEEQSSFPTSILCQLFGLFCPSPVEGLLPMSADEAAALRQVLDREVTTANAPLLLRLAFHDAGTWSEDAGNGGPNGSIMIPEEVNRPENRRLDAATAVITKIREGVRGTAAGSLSDADLIAAAGGFAVPKTGGIDIQVLKGRKDVDRVDPTGRLPNPVPNLNTLIANFARQGLDEEDLVNLTGSHTIGRLPGGASGVFDNNFFQVLLDGRGLPSDTALLNSERTRSLVELYAQDNAAFQKAFDKSYQKMVNQSHNVCK